MYGVSPNVDLGLRRTNLDTDYEGYAKVAVLRQVRGGSPVSNANASTIHGNALSGAPSSINRLPSAT